MRLNRPAVGIPTTTHEGAPAFQLTPLKELRRSVMSCLLWEDTFYESGQSITDRIAALIPKISPTEVAALAVEARSQMHLRHVPLLLVRALASQSGNGSLVADTLEQVIQRPDELTEYLALYWKDKPDAPLSAGSKRGLGRAFRKFNEYALAKYDRDGAVKLRDVLRLTHLTPKNTEEAALWKRVISRTLVTPDTWEVELSAGKDKKETFERLLREKKLGALAFLRNLRGMITAGVDTGLIRERFQGPLDRVLPFRFISAVRYAPMFAQELNDALLRVVMEEKKLEGRTVVLVDVSGSMESEISAKSEMTRMDAAAGLAVLLREISDCRVFSFSYNLTEVPAYRGLAMVEAIKDSQNHVATYLGQAMKLLNRDIPYDRLVVITDEQSHDQVDAPKGKGYMINVAPYQNGVGYGPWIHIDGWSERVLDFVREVEEL